MVTAFLVLYSVISSVMLIKHEQKDDELSTITENVSESIVSLRTPDGKSRATGFIVDTPKGIQVIVTNAHVCESSNGFSVLRRNKSKKLISAKLPSMVIAKDSNHDLCIVSVPLDLKGAISLKIADKVELDSKIYILGYPEVELLSSSEGYVRGWIDKEVFYNLPASLCVAEKYHIEYIAIEQKDGTILNKDYCFLRAKFMFTDATNDKGSSGSPGLNSDGEVVGVMSVVSGIRKFYAYLVPLNSLKVFLSKY